MTNPSSARGHSEEFRRVTNAARRLRTEKELTKATGVGAFLRDLSERSARPRARTECRKLINTWAHSGRERDQARTRTDDHWSEELGPRHPGSDECCEASAHVCTEELMFLSNETAESPVSGEPSAVQELEWRARHDSNMRPPGPQPGALSN